MLKVNNLTKIYKTGKAIATKALDHVSVDFGNTGLVFLLGKSGSGKTTLMNLLGGIDKASEGEVIINGRSSLTFSESDFDSYRNTYIGFVFQEYNLIPDYTVGGNVSLALELQGEKTDRNKIDNILHQVDLIDDKGSTLFDRQINELSGGQKQRVAIARALIKNPQIILADEPTGALDSKTGAQLYELLKKLSANKLVIVVTHDRENAEKYGDRIIELADGRIINDISAVETKIRQESERSDECEFIRSHLPFSRSLSMGASGLKHKKFRLAVSIVLSFVAFVIFGFSLTASFVDEHVTQVKTLYANDLSMFTIKSDTYTTTVVEHDKGTATVYEDVPFSATQLDIAREYNNNKEPMIVFNPGKYTTDSITKYLGETNSNLINYQNSNPYCRIGMSTLTRAAELDPATGMTDANLTPDKRFQNETLCRLPQTYDEIAITDLCADMFMKFGYKEEDGTETEIKNPDDLIGKKIDKLTICGIYSTEQDKSYFAQYDQNGYDIDGDFYLKSSVYNISLITYCFVRKGFLHEKEGNAKITSYLLGLSGDERRDEKFIKDFISAADVPNFTLSVTSAFSGFMAPATFFNDYMLLPFMIGAAVFSVFAALLMMNFLTVSIDFKKKELGILRALGARKKDILCICLIESLIIACIDFVLSLLGVFVLSFILNGMYYISLFNVGFIVVALMFLLCFGVAALATALPVIRITNKKPIDIINGK